MSEIWNLGTLCRCCHADGHFKSLNLSYQGINDVEIYENLLRDTLGVSISAPLHPEASYTICEKCILKLRDATAFKKQVLKCEEKFKIYCKNEQFLVTSDNIVVKSEENDGDCDDIDYDDTLQIDESPPVDVKKEYSIEVEIKHHIEEEVKREKQPKNEIRTVEESKHDEETNKKSVVPKKNTRIRKKSTNNGRECIIRNNRRNIDRTVILQVDTDTGTQFSCKDCGGLYQTKKLINRHVIKEHSTLFKCGYCSKQLKSFNSFKNHQQLHTGKVFQCSFCPKNFASNSAFKDHMNCHTREKIFKCDLCKKDFMYKQTLIKHLRVHAGTNKKILCDLCGKGFNDRSNLNAHVTTVHLKLRPFACKLCNKSFSLKRHLTDHLKIHSGNQKVYKCDVCDHRLLDEKLMKIHRLKHDHKFMCSYCSEVFDKSTLRKEHLKTVHQKERPWHSCPLCGKMFAGKYSLNRHMDFHKGIKRFPCNLCELKFSQKSVLERHVFRKHNPESDFNVGKTKCEICKHSFKNIVLHMNSHKNRSSCDLCGKTYADNSALNRHKAQKHFGRTFDCEICDKQYMQKSKLNTHKMKVHKIKIEKVVEAGS